jgi:beta-phosphoglucomutase-like phosphatase (HAD superfamily)
MDAVIRCGSDRSGLDWLPAADRGDYLLARPRRRHHWLRDARELGLRVAIASSSPSQWVRGHLNRVGALGLFDLVVTGDEVEGHKPDPRIYLLALERLGLRGEQAVAVEDTPHGVTAAAAAGIATVAIPNPFVAAEAVAAADLVLASAAERPLAEVLREVSSFPDKIDAP